MNKYFGPVFSLAISLGGTVSGVVTLLCTKLPLIMPVTLCSLAVVGTVMVAKDWKPAWKPLLVKKP